jgi:hypothetical protein
MNDLFRGKNIKSLSAEFTRPADTTAYATNDVVSNNTSATTMLAFPILRDSGTSAYLMAARISTNKKSITPRIRVHLFSDNSATVSADNAPYKTLYADTAKRIGYFDLPSMFTSADTTNSDMSGAADQTLRVPLVAGATAGTIYAVLETLDAFTPDSGQKFTLTLLVDQY